MVIEKTPYTHHAYGHMISTARSHRTFMPNRSRSVFAFVLAFVVFISISTGHIVQAKNPLPLEPATIQLTSEEKAWLKAHPNITLGYTDAFEPEVIVNPDGSHSGMLVDFLNALNKRLGTSIGLEIDSVPGILEKAKTKAVDGILEMHPEYADRLGLLKSAEYLTAYPAVFGRKDIFFSGPADFAGKKVAIVDEIYFTEKMTRQYGQNATIVKVKDALQGIKSVISGDADLFIGVSFNSYLIRKYQLFDVVAKHIFFDSPAKFGMAIRPDWPELVPILNKGISSFSNEEIEAIVAKWIQFPKQKPVLSFTPEEWGWLGKSHTVRVRGTQHAPLMYYKDGLPVGVSPDYLNEVTKRTGIKFEILKPGDDFPASMKGLIEHTGPDIIMGLNPTSEREKEIIFSKIYWSSPKFIFTRDDAPFVSSMADLSGRTVAVIDGYVTHKLLEKNSPDVILQIHKTNKQALTAVSSGKAFAFIGSLAGTSSMINEFGLVNLKACAPSTLPDATVAMGIRSDWPELRDIFNKVMDSMTAAEKAAIINKWSTVKFDHGIRSVDVLKWVLAVAGFGVAVVLLFVVWNRSLSRRVRERTEKLSESEKRFRATFEQAAVGIAHISPEGRFLRINQKFCDIVGYSREEMLEKTFQEITYPDDLETDLEHVRRLLAGEIKNYHLEKRYVCKNGNLVWIHLTVSLVRNEAEKTEWFVSVIKDITERKRTEVRLKESEQEFRDLVEQSPVVFELYDTNGMLLQVNPAFERLWNLLKEDVVGKFNVFESEQVKKQGFIPYFEKAFAGETITVPHKEFDASLEQVDNREKNRKRWLSSLIYPVKDINGHVTHVVMMHEDITERKEAQVALEQLRDYTDHLVKTANVMIIGLDALGQVTHFNPAAEEITGYSLEDVKGKSWFEMLVPHERYPYVHDEFNRLLEGGTPRFFENPILTKHGEERFISWSNSEIKKGPLIVGVISFGIDVTERRNAEESLKVSEDRFRQMMEQSPLSIQIMTSDGRISKVNQAWRKIWGFDEDSLQGVLDTYNILEDEQIKALGLKPLIKKAFKGESVVLPEVEYDATATMDAIGLEVKANKIWVRSTLYPVKDERGEVLSVVDIEEDITERKRAEEELLALKNQLHEENIYLREEIQLEHNFSEIIGNSEGLRYVLFRVEQIASTDTTVLILGETGTGKELIARAIHNTGPRKERPLIKVNCASLPAHLIESELFGHEKGAFTGATVKRIGRFELADGATLFLDEIGEMPLDLQSKLLRVLQDGEFERVGSSRTIKVDVRVIAATNRDLDPEIQAGRFRQDLFYRLNVYSLTLPPLRERREDIPLLVDTFIKTYNKKIGKNVELISQKTTNSLVAYSWPGNIRELQNVIEKAVIVSRDKTLRVELPEVQTTSPAFESVKTLEEVERDYIQEILQLKNWRIDGPEGAAVVLDLKPSTLRFRVKKLGIKRPT